MDPVGERTDAARRRRHIVVLLVFLGIIALLIFAFRAVLMPFLVALFIAYLIDPVVERMAPVRVFRGHGLGRGGAIVVLYVAFLFVVYLGIKFAGPALARQVRQIRTDLPNAQAWADMRAFRAPVVRTHEYNFFVLVTLTLIHVAAAVLGELREGGGLISAMFTGRKVFDRPPVDLPDDAGKSTES